MKKILLVHTGGTFGMIPSDPGRNLVPGKFQDKILGSVPELAKIVDIDVAIPFNLDSSNIGISEWDALSKLVYDKMDKYDGFVIIHGTDTMVYTASALSFSLLNLKKPVIITGSQRPLSKLRSDARSNLIDAIELATMPIPEVLIVFGQQILRGNRAHKTSITSYDAFSSFNYPLLGEIGLKIKLDQSKILTTHGASLLLPGFSKNVAVLSVYPSMQPQHFEKLIETDLQAFILLAFGAGNLPNSQPDWIPFIHSATAAGKPVIIGSHSGHGSTDLELYECGQKALEAGAAGLGDMTIEAAYVKLQKILTLSTDRQAILDKFMQNWAGEI